ncbi:MAG: serine/threonine-protein kinase [Planctomycetota bacterium]
MMVAHTVTSGGRIDDYEEVQIDRLRVKAQGLSEEVSPYDLGSLIGPGRDAAENPILLDAAIEIVLCRLRGSGMSQTGAVDSLSRLYPQYLRAIEDASLLGCIIPSATDAQERDDKKLIGSELGTYIRAGVRRYELIDLIDAGAHAATYSAFDRQLTSGSRQLRVAVKVFREASLGSGRHLEEAVRAASLEHPHVTRTIDFGETDDGCAYIVMERADSSLARASATFSIEEVMRFGVQLCSGLALAHAHGLIHGDIKPDNILLYTADAGQPPVVKLADFGCAQDIFPHAGLHSASDQPALYGNLAFMAPEVAQGASPRIESDIYSLAAMLQYLLTDLVPQDLSADIRVRDYLPARPRLRRLFQLATDTDPEKRPATAGELGDMLARYASHRSIPQIDGVMGSTVQLVRRKPVLVSAGLLLSAGMIMGGAGWQHAREGWAFEQGRLASERDMLQLYELSTPPFSARDSVYDLAGRLAISNSIQASQAPNWMRDDDDMYRARIHELRGMIEAAADAPFDRLLFREQLIFTMLQSTSPQPEVIALLEQQRSEFIHHKLLSEHEREQIELFSQIAHTKAQVLLVLDEEPYCPDTCGAAYRSIAGFLTVRRDPETGSLTNSARRDPLVRLAARALHWLSSPRMLDRAETYAWIDREYDDAKP